MARVSTYLNFDGSCAPAFEAYRAAFGTDYEGPVTRMRELHPAGAPPLPPEEAELVAHAALPILAGHVLHGTDVLRSQGQELRVGNNVTVHLETDDLAEAERLWDALAPGSTESTPLQPMPWGQHWGVLLDRFSVRWMLSAPLG